MPERGKNVPIHPLATLALETLSREEEVIRMELAKRFTDSLAPPSNVRWTGYGAKGKILELADGLFHSKELETCDGTSLANIEVVRTLGTAFNVDMSNQRVLKNQSRNRSKGAAQFLRALAELVEKRAEDLLQNSR
jgi:hypothetical protein